MNFLDAKVKVNGNDVTLTVGKYNMKLPASKAKAVIDGGYDGKTVVMGIRPENVHDSQMFIETSKDSVVECKINVYELLGAEVYLYFDCEGFPMTTVFPSYPPSITAFALEAGSFLLYLPTVRVTSFPLTFTFASRKFICGDPMNPATNRLPGALYRFCGVSTC